MTTAAIVFAVWPLIALVVAVVFGRGIRIADRMEARQQDDVARARSERVEVRL